MSVGVEAGKEFCNNFILRLTSLDMVHTTSHHILRKYFLKIYLDFRKPKIS